MKMIIHTFSLLFLTSLISSAVIPVVEPIILKPGDILHVQTPYNEANSPTQRDTLYIVQDNNQVNLGEGLGIIATKNLSPKDIEKIILKKFPHQNFPAVSVQLWSNKPTAKKVLLLGQLKRPSRIDFKQALTLEQAIEQCKGTTPFAAIKRIQLIRNKANTLINLKKQQANTITLQAGDIIYFPQLRWIGR